MISRLASTILNYIITHIDISSELKDIYQYGIEITISSSLNIILVLAMSLIIQDGISGLIFLSVFVFVRSFTGGYHASTYFMCNALMLLTFLLCYFTQQTINFTNTNSIISIVISIVNIIPIVLFSPVSNKHKPLSSDLKKRSKLMGALTSFLLSICGIILVNQNIKYGWMIIITVSAISVMMIIEIILQRRKQNESK
ncbi:MAG: accessory gene regulator B family protein [Ruminiclostridium sp.]|nr:accessory gene regulator B family protein [Ruminiclostridium sp.]